MIQWHCLMDKKLVGYSCLQNGGQWLRGNIVTGLVVPDASLIKGLILTAFMMWSLTAQFLCIPARLLVLLLFVRPGDPFSFTHVTWHFCLASSALRCITCELEGCDLCAFTVFLGPLCLPWLYVVVVFEAGPWKACFPDIQESEISHKKSFKLEMMVRERMTRSQMGKW